MKSLDVVVVVVVVQAVDAVFDIVKVLYVVVVVIKDLVVVVDDVDVKPFDFFVADIVAKAPDVFVDVKALDDLVAFVVFYLNVIIVKSLVVFCEKS